MTTVAPSRPQTALVILPTLNEAKNLPLLVPRILEHDGIRLMIVDDRSADGTGAVAEELAAQYPGRIEVMHRTGKRGLGLSYAEAFPKAAEAVSGLGKYRLTPTGKKRVSLVTDDAMPIDHDRDVINLKITLYKGSGSIGQRRRGLRAPDTLLFVHDLRCTLLLSTMSW